MSVNRETVLEALRTVRYPGFDRDVVSAGVVQDLTVAEGEVGLTLDAGPGDPAVIETIERGARQVLERLDGIRKVEIRSTRPSAAAGTPSLKMAGAKRTVAAAGALDSTLIPGVRQTIAVASGKGGVGKSTVAVNLSVALARQGARVGLLDADIYGPSIPMMTGIVAQPEMTPDRRLLPFERHGLRVMSIGFLVDAGSAVIWRGPRVMKAIEQLLRDVAWGELDFLVVDMPPGTGDAQLTLSQKVQLAGALIVTTPQDVALADAIKGVAMFRKVGVPVLGLVENMSYFRCPHCDERTEIFGHGGGRAEAERMGIPCLGEIPLDPEIRAGGDAGTPVAAGAVESPQAQAFDRLATRVAAILADSAIASPGARPGLLDRFRSAWKPPPD